MSAKSVLIPIPVVNRILDLFSCWNLHGYDTDTVHELFDIHDFLRMKLDSVDLRLSYANIIHADNEDDRDVARLNYLAKKSASK